MRRREALSPWHLNPTPMFGLRPRKCRDCGCYLQPDDNPIVDLGAGVLAKLGLCARCLSDEMELRRYEMEWSRQDDEEYERRINSVKDCGDVASDD